MAASVCRRFALSAPKLISRTFLRSSTPFTNNSTFSQVRPRHFNDLHRRFCSAKPLPQKETVTIHFVMPDGERESVKAKLGENLLDVIIENDVDIDGFGACEGTLACSTCHLIFKQTDYDKITEKPSDEELDMLDLAYELTETPLVGPNKRPKWHPRPIVEKFNSRLGCQVVVTKDMEGWEVRVPEGIADAREP